MKAREFIKKHWHFGAVCYLCGTEIYRHQASRDHVKPKCYGGTDAESNSRLAHRSCNSRRGHKHARPLMFSGVDTRHMQAYADD